ncbi:hypothetical protein MMC21_005485 [Puttea exsequens]|nr:hypothetical protein [Puttea exsequens]
MPSLRARLGLWIAGSEASGQTEKTFNTEKNRMSVDSGYASLRGIPPWSSQQSGDPSIKQTSPKSPRRLHKARSTAFLDYLSGALRSAADFVYGEPVDKKQTSLTFSELENQTPKQRRQPSSIFSSLKHRKQNQLSRKPSIRVPFPREDPFGEPERSRIVPFEAPTLDNVHIPSSHLHDAVSQRRSLVQADAMFAGRTLPEPQRSSRPEPIKVAYGDVSLREKPSQHEEACFAKGPNLTEALDSESAKEPMPLAHPGSNSGQLKFTEDSLVNSYTLPIRVRHDPTSRNCPPVEEQTDISAAHPADDKVCQQSETDKDFCSAGTELSHRTRPYISDADDSSDSRSSLPSMGPRIVFEEQREARRHRYLEALQNGDTESDNSSLSDIQLSRSPTRRLLDCDSRPTSAEANTSDGDYTQKRFSFDGVPSPEYNIIMPTLPKYELVSVCMTEDDLKTHLLCSEDEAQKQNGENRTGGPFAPVHGPPPSPPNQPRPKHERSVRFASHSAVIALMPVRPQTPERPAEDVEASTAQETSPCNPQHLEDDSDGGDKSTAITTRFNVEQFGAGEGSPPPYAGHELEPDLNVARTRQAVRPKFERAVVSCEKVFGSQAGR